MRFHPAIALALGLGWYLMLPPLSQNGDYYADSNAPLSRWTIQSSHDTAKKCEKARAKLKSDMSQSHGQIASVHSFLAMATCVASDDPRLKAN